MIFGGCMASSRFVARWFLGGAMVLGAGAVSGQDYPARPVRIITNEAGGGTDFVSRIVAQGLSGPLGQPVIVDNRPGLLATEIAIKAPPDGYSLMLAGLSLWTYQLLYKAPYDVLRDFVPITMATRAPNVLVVHPSVAANSVAELIALAKTQPGKLNYATATLGGSPHLAAEMFKSMAGVNIVHVAYRGTVPALNDLIAGQVQVMFAPASPVMPHVKSGKLRALGVTSAEPSALTPGLPTIAAAGLPGYESTQMYGMFAPAKTRAAVIERLNQEAVRVLNQAAVKEKLFNLGVEAVGSSAEQFGAAVRSDISKLGKLIKDAGIKAE
jgi:tripartite-type tricarboxylate transporter receptor subunit TctC